jgi:hypothetical protein
MKESFPRNMVFFMSSPVRTEKIIPAIVGSAHYIASKIENNSDELCTPSLL